MEAAHGHSPPPEEPLPQRRTFFRWLTIGLGAAATVLAAIPFLGSCFGWRKFAPKWVRLGPVKEFKGEGTRLVTFDNPIRQPWDGMTAHTGVFVRYEGLDEQKQDRFLVLAVNCAHLGCPVAWFPQSGLFMCPCHGGVYYANGEHASGPPPRGLYHCIYRINNEKGTDYLELQAPHYPTLQDTLRKDRG